MQAAKAARRDPDAAVDLYLEAVERTVSEMTGTGVESIYYRHATGQAVALLNSGSDSDAQPSRYEVGYARGKNLFSPSQFDSISFADAVELKEITTTSQEGIGAPMVCNVDDSPERRVEDHPLLPAVGVSTAATALVEFPARGKARISLHNVRRSDRVVFRGAARTLATNFTTPLVTSYDRNEAKNIGLRGILKPAAFFDEMGLYSIFRCFMSLPGTRTRHARSGD